MCKQTKYLANVPGCFQLWFNLCGFVWVATMRSPGGVEVTCVSVRFCEPIKDGRSSNRRTDGEGRSRRARAHGQAQRQSAPKPNDKQEKVSEAQSGGKQWRAHPLPEAAHTEPRRGHQCERRARERLRCRQTKLAAHLECRSHQWKMPASYPNFSFGKTPFVSVSSFYGS